MSTLYSKRRTYSCMKNLNEESLSDLDHLVLLNNYLQHSDKEQVNGSKKRKLTSNNRYIPNKVIIKEEEKETEDSTYSLTSIQLNPDFCEEIELRMKALSSRMDETLKKQEVYLEKYASKQVIQKKEAADDWKEALCKIYFPSTE
ncbi:predicted protein [Naegleria gruberi]|uniref:Predicted protein n=1 Tax=Naegleria gruberi TaxID=5762 RepID=D2V495_NAEGR|nr:uncharacterized protein NAEGRDRAFT_63643 [Naegleria gruberi]EFC48342.1 predicted protein [Naegleria gruberi]|eukprot:XP_002681086.1 predicted protein [Naegleria gruberi strain NEG-M]